MKLVKSKSIQHCSIHRQWPLQWHIYALPFTLIAYPIAVDAMLRHPEMADYRFPCFLILLTVHALLFLLTKWSSWWLVRFTSWEVRSGGFLGTKGRARSNWAHLTGSWSSTSDAYSLDSRKTPWIQLSLSPAACKWFGCAYWYGLMSVW